MRAVGSLLLIAFLACFISCKEQTEATISRVNSLIPKPLEAKEGKGEFAFSKNTGIYVSDSSKDLLWLGNYLADMVNAGYDKVIVQPNLSNVGSGHISLRLSDDVSLGKEGYEIMVDTSAIKIKAHQPAGIFYALQTLRLLFPDEIETKKIPVEQLHISSCQIKDNPRFAYRGAMLDVARHFFDVEDVKHYIDLIAMYKINSLHLGLTNDQGWRIEIKSWPKLTSVGGRSSVDGNKPGFYTQEQYKEIVRYAQERFITIIPEIDMPGHTNAALASYAELNCNDTATQLYTGIEVGFSSLCIRKDITYKFVDDVVRELSEITPGPWIHIGGDESHATKKEDYIFFIEKAALIVKSHGKDVIGWDEVGTASLPPNSISEFWAKDSNAIAAVKQGAKVLMAPAKKAYLDMQYDSTSKLGLHWAAYIEIDSSYSWDPAEYIKGIDEEQLVGVEAPLWSETLTKMDDIEYMAFPRLPGIAEIGWSAKANRNWEEYKMRLAQHGSRMKALDINFYRSKQIPWK